MFIKFLDKQEKEKFVSLLYSIALADGSMNQAQMQRVQAYMDEAAVSGFSVADDVDGLINYFAGKSEGVRKIVLIESMAVAITDNTVTDIELSIIDKINTKFELGDDFSEQAMDWLKQILPLYAKGFEIAGLV